MMGISRPPRLCHVVRNLLASLLMAYCTVKMSLSWDKGQNLGRSPVNFLWPNVLFIQDMSCFSSCGSFYNLNNKSIRSITQHVEINLCWILGGSWFECVQTSAVLLEKAVISPQCVSSSERSGRFPMLNAPWRPLSFSWFFKPAK